MLSAAQEAPSAAEDEDFFASFKPVAPANGDGRHLWRASNGPDAPLPTVGASARCEKCGMRVDARVDVALGLRPVLYLAGAEREPYAHAKHGRCPR